MCTSTPALTPARVEQALRQVLDPHLQTSLFSTHARVETNVENDAISVNVMVGYPLESMRDTLQDRIAAAVSGLPGVKRLAVAVDWTVLAARKQPTSSSLADVRNIVAVASGKGGVGKSTTSVNLALALMQEGARVGLLDADIYGPSQQMMLGVPTGQGATQTEGQQLQPAVIHGLKVMTMGLMVNEKTPLVWRGPMAGGVLQRMLQETQWGELDYLIVDMPPGTGDIQLTLAQQTCLDGAVIVTTPQDIALLDALKGVEMFNKVRVPVLGVVENMATHICSQCGHEEFIFGVGGGARVARDYRVPLLGSLPLDLRIRQSVDDGRPTLVSDPGSPVSETYRHIARTMAAYLAERQSQAEVVQIQPAIEVGDT